MSVLRGLLPGAYGLIADTNFRTGAQPTIDARPYLVDDLGLSPTRAIDTGPLRRVVQWAMQNRTPRTSDEWLGPRVHATLRLTRREAADKRIWAYLTAVEFPDYVRWRWRKDIDNPEDTVPIDRFIGENRKNSLGRLWWTAELTRNGSDYSATSSALAVSRFSVSWMVLEALNHRPVALAVAGFLSDFGGAGTTDPQGQLMAKVFNLAARTLSLDALAESPATDAEAVREWIVSPVDDTLMMDALPFGPDEAAIKPEAVAAVRGFLDRLADRIKLAEFIDRRER